MKTFKGGASVEEHLKYFIFLLLHLDNNNYDQIVNIEADENNTLTLTPGRPKKKILEIVHDEEEYTKFANRLKGNQGNKNRTFEVLIRDQLIELINNRKINLNNHYFSDKDEIEKLLDDTISISTQIKENEPARDVVSKINFSLPIKKTTTLTINQIKSGNSNSKIIHKLGVTLENLLYLKTVLSEQYEKFGRTVYNFYDANSSYFNSIEEILKTLYNTENITEFEKKNIQDNEHATSTVNGDNLNKLFALLPPPPPPQPPQPPQPPTAEEEIIQGKASIAPQEQVKLQLEREEQEREREEKESEKKEALENGIALKGYTIPSSKGNGYAANSKGNFLWNTAFISNRNLPYNTVDTVDVYLYNLFKQISDETTGHMKKQSNQAEKSIDNIGSVFEFKTEDPKKPRKEGGKKTKGKKRYKNKTRRKYKK